MLSLRRGIFYILVSHLQEFIDGVMSIYLIAIDSRESFGYN